MHRLSLILLVSSFLTGLAAAQPTVSLTMSGSGPASFMDSGAKAAGDVNNDGVGDFIAGAPFDSGNGPLSGSVTVFSGVDGSVLYHMQGAAPSSRLGNDACGVGDINNDGFDDFMAGAPGIFFSGVLGVAVVYSGVDGSVIYTFSGDAVEDRFGVAVDNAGDVNMDGVNDFIVGAFQDDDNGLDSGSARVFSGADGSTLHTVFGDAALDFFGVDVAGIGDVNSDGHADFLVGANGDDDNGAESGSASAYSGVDGSLLFKFNGDSAGDLFGQAVSPAGDVNFDLVPDILVGAPEDDNNGPGSGSCRVFSGVDGSTLFTISGEAAGDNFGIAVSNAGDVDRDLFDDIIIGANVADHGGVDAGRAYVVSGFDQSIVFTVDGAAGEQLGTSVGAAGDTNLDGFADVLIGSRFASPGGVVNAGALVLYQAETGPVLGYEATTGTTDLVIRWTPDGSDPQSITGTMSCFGATPGAIGLFGVSLAPAQVPLIFGFNLLIAIDTSNLIDEGNFGFSVLGDVHVGGLSRQAPSLAGLYVFIQFYEIAPFVKGSNGVAMLLAP